MSMSNVMSHVVPLATRTHIPMAVFGIVSFLSAYAASLFGTPSCLVTKCPPERVPQVALMQPMALRRVGSDDVPKELWDSDSGEEREQRYRLSSHEDADDDATNTRFRCRFHDPIPQPSGGRMWPSWRRRSVRSWRLTPRGGRGDGLHQRQNVIAIPLLSPDGCPRRHTLISILLPLTTTPLTHKKTKTSRILIQILPKRNP